ncbi:fungal-specific transcription factor domain-containing protein [Coniochaeta sp. 2T2.1]|nr:fungal-specific transcription factor domain-containing protein [Coniochaeta sp. 2T2.1]
MASGKVLNSASASPEPESSRKRRRVALACDECRERKRKCDGVKPVCGSCSRRSARRCTTSTKDVITVQAGPVPTEPTQAPEFTLQSQQPQQSTQGYTTQSIPDLDMSLAESVAHSNTCQRPSYMDTEASRASVVVVDDLSTSSFDGSSSEPNPLFKSMTQDDGIYADDNPEGVPDVGETAVDGMGVVGSADDGMNPMGGRRPRRQPDYFGPSSTMSLLSKARTVLGRRFCEHGPLALKPSTRQQSCASCRGHVMTASDKFPTFQSPTRGNVGLEDSSAMFDRSLPPRNEADSLVETYFEWYHSLYPFIHRPAFYRRYLAIWTRQTDIFTVRDAEMQQPPSSNYYDSLGDRCFHCLLNLVFALGALFSTRTDERQRESVSRSFFDRAKKLLDLDLLAQGSIGLVQTLLLMAQYLQSTSMSSSCWNVAGLAIRVAQGIGLHREPKGHDGSLHYLEPSECDQLDTEMRRRTWAGCVILDRVLSLTYGRPLMVHPSTTRAELMLPSAIDDEFLTQQPKSPGLQPVTVPSMTECFVQTVRLQDILGQVLAEFYYAAPAERKQDSGHFDMSLRSLTTSAVADVVHGVSNFQVLFDVDNLLTTWHRELPSHLQAQTYQSSVPISINIDPERAKLFHRQAVVLETRYLHTRVTMLLPVLHVFLESGLRSGVNTPRDNPIHNGIQDDMLLKAARLCLSITQDLVNLITGKTQSSPESLPAPWYNIFYIHSSAMVLVIGYLCSLHVKHVSIVTETSLVEAFDRCLAFLHGCQPQSPSVQNCYKILRLVKQEVFVKHEVSYNKTQNGDTDGIDTTNDTPNVTNVAWDTVLDKHGQQGLDMDALQHWDSIPFSPSQLDIEGNLDESWIWEPSDMAWLSFMPGPNDQV